MNVKKMKNAMKMLCADHPVHMYEMKRICPKLRNKGSISCLFKNTKQSDLYLLQISYNLIILQVKSKALSLLSAIFRVPNQEISNQFISRIAPVIADHLQKYANGSLASASRDIPVIIECVNLMELLGTVVQADKRK